MKKLTREEERIMQVIWQLEKAFVNDIIEHLNEETAPYSTISSVVRILGKKGFVGHKTFGKTHQYFPIISKEEYRVFETERLVKDYFDGSVKQLVSFFSNDKHSTIEELRELLSDIENKIEKSDD